MVVVPLCRYLKLIKQPVGDMFKLEPRWLNLPLVVSIGSETGDVLRCYVENELRKWEVLPGPGENPVWATTDRGSNICKAIRESPVTTHVPCFSHVANRAITAALDAA